MTYWIHSMPGTMDDDGQRHCARGERCLNATVTTTNGHRTLEPALGYRALCDTDRELALRCVEALPGYHQELGDRIGEKQQASGAPKVSGSREAPIPMNLSFDELRVDLVNVIASWAERVAIVAKLTMPEIDRSLAQRARYGAPLTAHTQEPFTRMCEMVAAHLDALLALTAEPMNRVLAIADCDALPIDVAVRRDYWTGYAQVTVDLDGANAALEIFRLNGRCRWLLGHTGKDQRISGRCFSCDRLDVLVRPDSSAGLVDHAECSECGARYFGAEYTMLLRDAYEREVAKLQQQAS